MAIIAPTTTPTTTSSSFNSNNNTNRNYRLNNGRIYKYTYKFDSKSTTKAKTDHDSESQPSSSASPSVTTLLDYLCTASSNFGRAGWKRRILRGEIFVEDSIVTDVDYPMTKTVHRSGCCLAVSYHRPPWLEPVVEVLSVEDSLDATSAAQGEVPDANSLLILYQDDHMMAVHKPSGLPTMHSQTFCDYTILNALRGHALKQTARTDDKQYLAPPQPVHRLGVGTSGVLLVATSLPARQFLSRAIRDKRVTKVYRALVTGADTIPDTLRIDCPIGPVPFPIGGSGMIYAACPNDTITKKPHPGAKQSLSLVSVVRRHVETNQAVVDVTIPTGRPHQIRIHMAYAGHPLVGDPLYMTGGIPDARPRFFPKEEDEDMDTDDDDDDDDDMDGFVMRVPLPRDCGYSLHAHKITVEHPVLVTHDENGNSAKQWMNFTAQPPAHLA